MKRVGVACGCLLFAASAARAQAPSAEASRREFAPLQEPAIAVGVDSASSPFISGRSWIVSVTIPRRRPLSVELFAGIPENGDAQNTRATYGFQLRVPLIRHGDPRLQPYVASGFMGSVQYERDWDCGDRPGCHAPPPYVIVPPIVWLIGGGASYRLASHLALRVEAQGALFLIVPSGARVGAALVVPLTRH